jgi:hypothetical protein
MSKFETVVELPRPVLILSPESNQQAAAVAVELAKRTQGRKVLLADLAPAGTVGVLGLEYLTRITTPAGVFSGEPNSARLPSLLGSSAKVLTPRTLPVDAEAGYAVTQTGLWLQAAHEDEMVLFVVASGDPARWGELVECIPGGKVDVIYALTPVPIRLPEVVTNLTPVLSTLGESRMGKVITLVLGPVDEDTETFITSSVTDAPVLVRTLDHKIKTEGSGPYVTHLNAAQKLTEITQLLLNTSTEPSYIR